MGVFQKDETEFTGDFVEGWRSALESVSVKQVVVFDRCKIDMA